jgi:hypothetical protein
VTGHPLGGSAEAFGDSTARFEHDRRPDVLEEQQMSGSYRTEMWRRLRLHIRILLSRMGCFTEPHQDQLSTDPRAQTHVSPCWLSTPERAV